MAKFEYDPAERCLNIYALNSNEFENKDFMKQLGNIMTNIEDVNSAVLYVDKKRYREFVWDGSSMTSVYRHSLGEELPKIPFFRKFRKEIISIKIARSQAITTQAYGGRSKVHYAIAGELTFIDYRATRENKYHILSFGFFDGTEGLNGTYFAKSQEEAETIKSALKVGDYVQAYGSISQNKYTNDLDMDVRGINLIANPDEREDRAPKKRVELHLRSNMSEQEALGSIEEYVERALRWGHSAIAITDTATIQGYKGAKDVAQKYNFKMIYGLDAFVVDDITPIGNAAPDGYTLDDRYVVFDIETTGLSSLNDQIIQIAAVRVEGRQIVDSFSSYVYLDRPLPQKIKELTNIDDESLKNAPELDSVMNSFMEFVGGDVLVAHNAGFDIGFINKWLIEKGYPARKAMDTEALSRLFLEMKSHRLDKVAKRLDLGGFNHHRADADAEITGKILIALFNICGEHGISTISELNDYYLEHMDVSAYRKNRITILIRSEEGRTPLYRLMSDGFLYNDKSLRLSKLLENREHLLLGSGTEDGFLMDAAFSFVGEEELERIASMYDFIELQPAANFVSETSENSENKFNSLEQAREFFKSMYDLAKKVGAYPVATGGVCYMDPDDQISRDILIANRNNSAYVYGGDKHFRTTDEMLEEFSYLGDAAENVVVEYPIVIASLTEPINPVPDGKFPPEILGADDELRSICYGNAKAEYGETLPNLIEGRLSKELKSIVKNGYASLYITANRLVKKSNDDGFLVGSRGSVGSSLVAHFGGISEVNPLPPHYHCTECSYTEFVENSPVVGCDLPIKKCPKCGKEMKREGFDIPFEAFLGFKGEKEPDIDLNFASIYQSTAQRYCEEIFGEGHTFKIETVQSYKEKRAIGDVEKYKESEHKNWSKAAIMHYAHKMIGVKKASGQHPGGVLVLPEGYEMEMFSPISKVVVTIDGVDEEVRATHFDYSVMEGTLLKMDVLAHEVPTMLNMMEQYTGFDPDDVRLDDPETLAIFNSTGTLGFEEEGSVGSLGIPEFGTKNVMDMLKLLRPNSVTELVKISGLSHGTNVWHGNAKEDIESGRVEFNEVISTREDIMNKLVARECDASDAFKIMERVRKGKGVNEEDLATLKRVGMPDWYIESCQKIQYLFPKAHAAAYVMQSLKVAYYKVHFPQAFYCAHFNIKIADFDSEVICAGLDRVSSAILDIDANPKPTDREIANQNEYYIAEEMYRRGINMLPVDLYRSDPQKFSIVGNDILPPLMAAKGVSESGALSIAAAREDGKFISIQDLKMKTGIKKNEIEGLRIAGCLDNMSERNQLSLF